MWLFPRRKRLAPSEAPAPKRAARQPAPEAPADAPPHVRTADDVLRQLSAEDQAEAAKAPPDPEVGRVLLAEGPITSEYLRQQLAVSGRADTYLGRVLTSARSAGEDELFQLLARRYRVPHVDLKECKVLLSVATSVPREIALKYGIVPIDRIGDILCVVFSGKPNPKAIEAVRRATGLRVKALRCPAHHIKILSRRLFQAPSAQQLATAVPISDSDYDEGIGGPEARWESLYTSGGPIRAVRLAPR